MEQSKKKIYIYIYITFHQIKKVSPRKVTSPLLLNKMMATSITKQPRKARITSNYKIAEEGLFHINYKIVEEGLFHINYKIAKEGSDYH